VCGIQIENSKIKMMVVITTGGILLIFPVRGLSNGYKVSECK
jgi:hypothetical protein